MEVKNKDSHLLKELSKLKDSSREAVEFVDNLSEFKQYMHINRSIQEDFLKELERVKNEDSNHLIMLCGSVGDGKSHILAYLKTDRPDLYNSFKIHNDATESFNPDEDAIDTLAKVLKPFNDTNFDYSNDKVILAINLGVLNKFLESDYCKNEYTKLKKIIDKANIFDTKIVSKNIFQNKVSFITFSDYNLFELTERGTSSKYISSLFDKITSKNENNPFYAAYNEDKKLGINNVVMYNYEMFLDKEVQNVIIHYLIKIFIKYKKIVSTRDLLNFIYEIIVPYDEIETSQFNTSSMKFLLPNLLFDNDDRSDILKLYSHFDPTNNRNEELDKFIIDFYIKNNLDTILKKYFVADKINFLKEFFKENNTFNYDKLTKEEIISTLIRFLIFYGNSSVKQEFADDNYEKFLNYLYYYNLHKLDGYKMLFVEIEEAIFNWKGSSKNNYICIDALNNFKVFKYINLDRKKGLWDENLLEGFYLGNRFKTEVQVYFQVPPSQELIELDVDFSLYDYIMKINDGFKPNKSEKEDLTLFDEFIESLINESESKELYVKSLDTGAGFYFKYYDDMNSFEFKGA